MCNPHPVAEVPCFSLDQSDDDDDILEVGANASSPTDAAECQADSLDQTDTSAEAECVGRQLPRGSERELILISLVRSNSNSNIGCPNGRYNADV